MKLKLVIFISLIIFLIIPNFALAQESSVGAKPWQVKQEQHQEEKEALKAKLTEALINKIKNIYNRIKTKLENRIKRIGDLADKIESYFPKWEEKGRDTTQAKAKISEARTALTNAQTDLASVDSILEELLASADPKSLKGELNDAVKKVRLDLITARQALAQSVELARALEGGNNDQ